MVQQALVNFRRQFNHYFVHGQNSSTRRLSPSSSRAQITSRLDVSYRSLFRDIQSDAKGHVGIPNTQSCSQAC
jgi:hypothetical protein